MDDYRTLGLEQGASQKEIKKAYFSLVRKYSPEESPEKFREIREAYERLKGQTEGQGPMFPRPSDPLAEKFLDLYWKYRNARDPHRARDVCEEAWKRFPEEIQFLYHLALAQRCAGNSGKSVKSCEELVKREPENKWFWRELAISYDERSYTRKAYMAYEKAYELGCRDNGFLLDFSTSCDNYEQYDRGIQVLTELARKDRRWKREEIKDVLSAYCGILMMSCRKGADFSGMLPECSQFIRQYSIYIPDHLKTVLGFCTVISMNLELCGSSHELIRDFFSAVEKACVSEKDKAMFAIAQERYMDHCIWADERLTETVQNGMQVFFQMDDEPMDIRSYALLDLKLCMIEERQEVLPQLEILKEEYPLYYEKIREFAEQLQNGKNLGYLKSSLLKQYTRLAKYMSGGKYFEKYPDEKKKAMGTVIHQNDGEKPFVRSGKKIGRNDPCPCGSGKKYKHCCMKKERA